MFDHTPNGKWRDGRTVWNWTTEERIMKAAVAVRSLYSLIVLHHTCLVVDGWLSSKTATATATTRWICRASNTPHISSPIDRSDDDPMVERNNSPSTKKFSYDLGLGKNKPVNVNERLELDDDSDDTVGQAAISEKKFNTTAGDDRDDYVAKLQWNVAEPVRKPKGFSKNKTKAESSCPPMDPSNKAKSAPKAATNSKLPPVTTRRMIARDERSRKLRNALWDETHFASEGTVVAQAAANAARLAANMNNCSCTSNSNIITVVPTTSSSEGIPPYPTTFYPNIDLSIPETVYSDDGRVDLVWDLLRWEAYEQATREPLLVSFLHSTILNHPSLESSLAFLLANRLQSPGMMISTQLQSIILEALQHNPVFRRSLRADIMAVRDRDPACNQLPDVFLYFKGFHALQSYRVAHSLWLAGKGVLAQFLQSQVSQIFQIDIHPNATLGSGLLVDHGTGVVIGSTATVGHNCSILHHVTLGGSGKKGVDRHPKVGNGVLLGAGATVLGPVTIGEGCQVGAGTLVISDLPAHSVAVGVPARIIGSFVDVTEQPSIEMNQMMDQRGDIVTFGSDGI